MSPVLLPLQPKAIDGSAPRGEPLKSHISHDILSEGILPGCIQVPSNGQPIILMRDIPCTGGYPKIAIMASEDISKIAQLPPGTKITFDL